MRIPIPEYCCLECSSYFERIFLTTARTFLLSSLLPHLMMLIKTLIEEICFHFSWFGSLFFIFEFFTSFENHPANLFLSTLCVLSFLKICLPHRFLASYCLLVIIFFSCCFLDLNWNYLKFLATLFLIFHY